MQNLLIILAVLFAALFVVIPLVQRFAKPVTAEQVQKYSKIIGFLLILMALAMIIRYFMNR